MAQKRYQRFQEDADLELELIAFFHQPILQMVLEQNLKAGCILVSPVMLLHLVNWWMICKRLQAVQYFFSPWQLA